MTVEDFRDAAARHALTEGQTLYRTALDADARLSEVAARVTGGKRDRWTMTGQDLIEFPELREALREKLNADDQWLSFLRGRLE